MGFCEGLFLMGSAGVIEAAEAERTWRGDGGFQIVLQAPALVHHCSVAVPSLLQHCTIAVPALYHESVPLLQAVRKDAIAMGREWHTPTRRKGGGRRCVRRGRSRRRRG